MRLGHAMFPGGISWFALFRANLAAAGYAALKLRSNFFAASFFEWIRATAAEDDASDCDKDRKGPHPLILGTKDRIANCRLQISNCLE